MRLHSEFILNCLCGRELRTETGLTICPNCRREIRVEWHPEEQADAPKVASIDTRRAA